MALVYWVNQGRLGNLLFQYVALRALTSPRDTILCFDNELFDLVQVDERFIRMPRRLGWRINYETNKMARRFVRWGVVGATMAEIDASAHGPVVERSGIIRRDGWLKSVRVFDGYFQRDAWALPPPRLKADLIARARTHLDRV